MKNKTDIITTIYVLTINTAQNKYQNYSERCSFNNQREKIILSQIIRVKLTELKTIILSTKANT